MPNRYPLTNTVSREERRDAATRVTIVGGVVNLLLALTKLAAGILGSSTAMVADAAHSLSDLITDVIVFISTRVASQAADEDHPYGHGRAETIGSAALGIAVIGAGIMIMGEVIDNLDEGNLLIPTWPALAAAVVSIVSNEALYHYTVKVGVKINNETIIANAWHHRTDSLSSGAALIGIGGAMIGFPILDPLAAIVVVFMVVKVGWDITGQAVKDLMDTSLPSDKIKVIRDIILSTEGVRQYHELRTRKLGADIFVDVHVLVQKNISVTEAHNIAETARANLKEKGSVMDALIHIDAEEDADYKLMLLDRNKLEREIKEQTDKIEILNGEPAVIIHYLRKRICVDIDVDISDDITIGEAKEKMERLREKLIEHDAIDHVVVHGRLTAGLLESDFLGSESK